MSKYLLEKDEAKETLDEGLMEVKRVYEVTCDTCNRIEIIIQDSEIEIKEHLIDEMDWSVAEEIDENGEEEHTIVCDDCKLLIG